MTTDAPTLTADETATLAALNAGAVLVSKSGKACAAPGLSWAREFAASGRPAAAHWPAEFAARIAAGLSGCALRPFLGRAGRVCVDVTSWRNGANFGAQRTVALADLVAAEEGAK